MHFEIGINLSMQALKGCTLFPGSQVALGHSTLIAQNTLGVSLEYFSKRALHTTQELISRLKAVARLFNGLIIDGY